MKNISKVIETLANVAIVVVAVLISITLVKNYLSPTASPAGIYANKDESGLGRKVNLADVDWSHNGQTIVLALSSTCRFCTESAPFYQRLTKERSIPVIAVMPQAVSEGQAYLNKLGIDGIGLRQVSFGELGIVATPMLMLVNESGVVTDSWVGKLGDEQEKEVLRRLLVN